MSMKKVGVDISSEDRWNDVATSYAETIQGVYHSHRFAMVSQLIGNCALAGNVLVQRNVEFRRAASKLKEVD